MSSTSRERNSSRGKKFLNRNSSSRNPKKIREVFLIFKQRVNNNLVDKYQTDENSLKVRTINEIIYNEKAHVVSVFKDFLIFDDTSEFLKRFYKNVESKQRLPRIFEFYESFSKIFANYIILPESKYMYKNIQRKQKMIDNLQKLQGDMENPIDKDNDNIFNTEIYNSIMNQTPQLEDYSHNNSYKIRISSSKMNSKQIGNLHFNNSADSIEMLIESIGKAEKISRNPDDNFNTIYSNTSDGTIQINKLINKNIVEAQNNNKFQGREMNKLHSPNPSISTASSLLNNISNFNKNKQIEINGDNKKIKATNLPAKNIENKKGNGGNTNKDNTNSNPNTGPSTNPNNTNIQGNANNSKKNLVGTININNLNNNNKSKNIVEKFEKILVINRAEKTDRYHERNEKRLHIINSDSNHNTLLANSTTVINGLNTIATIPANSFKPYPPNNYNENPNSHTICTNTVLNKKGNNPIHKSTMSMPKLNSSKILNNFNLNNYQTVLGSSIEKHLISTLGQNLRNSKGGILTQEMTSCSANNNLVHMPSNNDASPPHQYGIATNSSKTLSNKPSEKAGFLSTVNSLNNGGNGGSKDTLRNNALKGELNKYIKIYTSDISKIKKKVSTIVNDSTHNKIIQKTIGLPNKCSPFLNSNTNTISATNTINSRIKPASLLEKKKETRNNSLNTRQLEALKESNPNSLRSILQKELFEGDAQTERILKKNIVENTRVYLRPESKMRDNIISRNSADRLDLNNTKEKQGIINTSNTKNYSILNLTDRKIEYNNANTNLSSPKNIYGSGNKNGGVSVSLGIGPNGNSVLTINANNTFLKNSKPVDNEFNKNTNNIAYNANSNGLEAIKNFKKISNNELVTNKTVTAIPGSNTYSSQTPTKQVPIDKAQKITKTNFLNDNINSNNVFSTKCMETARKLHESKIINNQMNNTNICNNNSSIAMSTINTSNTTGVQNKMKIKNFYEVIKNGNAQSNSNSARASYNHKTELVLFQLNSKKSGKKFS